MDRWMDGWVNRWVGGWVDGWMDGWVDDRFSGKSLRTGASLAWLGMLAPSLSLGRRAANSTSPHHSNRRV